MKTAVVLGAAGFVGRHVARAFANEGYRVIGIGHGSWSRDEWRGWGLADWHLADVDLEALLTYAGEPDVLVQCAGSGSVPFSVTHPIQDYHRSVSTTMAALEFVRTHAPRCRLVLPSSAAVYGTVHRMPIQVTDPLMPVSPYGTHKKIAEEMCVSYGRHFDVSAAIVRLFSVYGIGLRKQLVWDACTKLTSGPAEFGGTGRELRDWLHIDDAAALLVKAAAHASPATPIANGGTGVAVATGHIVATLAGALGVATPPRFVGSQRVGDPVNHEADIGQAIEWGWTPTRDLDTELVRFASWFADSSR